MLHQEVAVQLFACNAGLTPGESQNWHLPNEGPQGGQGSYAHKLQQALAAQGKDASVFAHITAGHTTENFSARVFGAEAERVVGDGNIASLFDLVFHPSYVAMCAYSMDLSVAEVREKMWKEAILPNMYTRVLRNGRYESVIKGDLGSKIFTDPNATRPIFVATWEAKHPEATIHDLII